MAGWDRRKIGSLGRVVTGKTPSTAVQGNFNGIYPFITIPDLIGRVFIRDSERTLSEMGADAVHSSLLPANAVMMSCIATVGRCGITAAPSFTNQQINSVICNGDVDPAFLYYSFTQLGHAMESAGGGGSVYTNVSKSRFADIEILLPPFPEQRAIADILGSLDDKIELNRRTNETLEAMARALFKSWFVDFDPVVAKSKGRQPEGMAAETAKLFPSSFVDSEIGRVPKGWKIGAVSTVADINAWTLGKNDDLDSIRYVEISEVSRGDIGNIQIFERGQEPSRARRRLRHGDTVLSTVRPDRRSYFLCLNPPQELIASTGFAVLSPAKVPWSFLHAGLTQPDVFDHLGQHADGGAYPAVRPELIGQWSVPLPDDDAVLDAFHGICGGLFERADANRRQTIVLSQCRDSLLPRLLSGELTVPASKVA